jgi:hypothetical protein
MNLPYSRSDDKGTRMSHEAMMPSEPMTLEDVLTLSYPREHEALVRKLAQRFLLCTVHAEHAGMIVEAPEQAGILTIRYPGGYEPLAFESIHTWLEVAQTCGLIDSYTEEAREHVPPLLTGNQTEDPFRC